MYKVITDGTEIYRILKEEPDAVLAIDCEKRTMPSWYSWDKFSLFQEIDEPELDIEPTAKEEQTMNVRFTAISDLIDLYCNGSGSTAAIKEAAERQGVDERTLRRWLCRYLAFMDKRALIPERRKRSKLSDDEKNIRWGLNKFYYTADKRTLKAAYRLMIKAKYTDEEGRLLSEYPSYMRFYRFYKKTLRTDNLVISRQGKSEYQRNHRPMTGGTVQDYVKTIGVGMADSTTCDIFLVDDGGKLLGRPQLVACVDAFSTLCLGFYVGWDESTGGLVSLLHNMIADKKRLYGNRGFYIADNDWPSGVLPGKFITDRGLEYLSEQFGQITELGITLEGLDAYRPDLKSEIERFFGVIQGYIRPYLTRCGWIASDFRQRGAPDYRDMACLTLKEFEEIIVNAILYYNTKRVMTSYPFTDEMLRDGVKPYAADVWQWAREHQQGANLIPVSEERLKMTMLPRTNCRFSKRGLVVNGLRYRNNDYKEAFLTDRDLHRAAFDPDDVSFIYLIEEDGSFVPFELIETRYRKKGLSDVEEMKSKHQDLIRTEQAAELQAQIDMADNVQAIIGRKKR